jgi:hypothetical protein
MDQRCSESNGLPKDEDSKLKREEEKNAGSRKHISLAVTAFCHVFHIPML